MTSITIQSEGDSSGAGWVVPPGTRPCLRDSRMGTLDTHSTAYRGIGKGDSFYFTLGYIFVFEPQVYVHCVKD